MQKPQEHPSSYIETDVMKREPQSSSEPTVPSPSPELKIHSDSTSNFSALSAKDRAYTIENISDTSLSTKDDSNKIVSKPTRKGKFQTFLTFARPMLVILFVDVGLPLAVYYILKIWLSLLISLILSGVPPLIRVFYVFWKKRQVNILGCIFVISFALSAVLSLINGDVRLTLLRDSTVTAIIGLMFFITLIPLQTRWFIIRPIIFLISQHMMSEQPLVEWVDREGNHQLMEKIEWQWQNVSYYRNYCYMLGAIWGTVLLAEFLTKIIMIQSSLDMDHIILYGNIILVCTMVTMTICTLTATHFVRKRCQAVSQEWYKKNNFADKLPQ